jgi:membrane associated rhomboid family serine protease
VQPSGRYRGTAGFGGGWPGGRPAPDITALLAVVFGTWVLQFFAATAAVPALLRLTPAVWRSGFLWELVTYPFVGFGPASPWILLELLVLLWFGQDVRARLGRRGFWTLVVSAAAAAALVAVAVQLAAGAAAGPVAPFPFQLMQGQRMLLAILIAAFATLYGDATILLFFVVPMPARWFLWLEVALAFVAFLASKDLAGFAGICAAVAVTVLALPGSALRQRLRRRYLSWRARRIERRLARLAKRRGLRVIRRDDDRGDGPIN